VDFYRPKKSIAFAGFEPTIFESSGKRTNHYITKPSQGAVWDCAVKVSSKLVRVEQPL
jgi:hypothetical protein